MPEEFNNGNDTNNKIKIDNLLNSSSGLEESIENSRTKPLDSKFLSDFLESDSNRSSPINHNELSSNTSPQYPPSTPYTPSLYENTRQAYGLQLSP